MPGDAFIFGPDEPHQLINSGDEDFIFYVIADNPIGDSAYIPDSGKWKVNKSSAADRVVIKGQETDWFDGEERPLVYPRGSGERNGEPNASQQCNRLREVSQPLTRCCDSRLR